MAYIDSLFSSNIPSKSVSIPGTEGDLPVYMLPEDPLPTQTLKYSLQDSPDINSELQDEQCNDEPFDFEQYNFSDFLCD